MNKHHKSKISQAKRHLQTGSIVTHCGGFNGIVQECSFIIDDNDKIVDVDLVFENGRSCSLVHCCEYPRRSKAAVLKYFQGWQKGNDETQEYSREWFGEQHWKIIDAVRKGIDPFDDKGRLLVDKI